jgi:NAD(P)-dependent dehydrogenase (short-subunit alcohol dehydrogenase family)
MSRLSGRKALVTGGAKGIGAAIVTALAQDGAHVVICDLDAAAGEALAQACGGVFARADVTDFDAMEKLVATHGAFDILVNNAGMDQHAFFTDTNPGDWARLLSVNLSSVLISCRLVLPQMQKQGYGRIVNIASEAARLGSKGGAVYAAAKAGVIGFTKSIARENARYGVTVNVIAPGPIDTPMLRQAVEAGGEKLLDAMKGATLVRRLGSPQEIAAATVFLAGADAGFITGETLGVSGGMGIGG